MLKQPDPKRNKVCQASIKYIIRIKAIFDNGECKYFYAYKDASRQLKIDKGSIRYAFKFKNGRCDKIKATFVKITEKEYKNKSKK